MIQPKHLISAGHSCLQQAYSKTYQPTNFPFPTIHPTFYPVVNPANSPGVLPQGTFQHVLRLHVHGRRSELRQGPVQGHLRAVGQTYGVGFRMLERVKSFTYWYTPKNKSTAPPRNQRFSSGSSYVWAPCMGSCHHWGVGSNM